MERLYVLYDGRCGLCRRARLWVEGEPKFVEVVFLAAGSEAARRAFPTLATADPPEELIAVSDAGEVYRGGSAWVMVLYALRDYREWALRLGTPALLPLARQGFAWLSKRRGILSRILGLEDDDLAATLRGVEVPACEVGAPDPGGGPHPDRTPSPSAVAGRWTGAAGWRRKFGL